MTLQRINDAQPTQAYQLLESCCCASNWVKQMLAARPFKDQQSMLNTAQQIWETMTETDVLEAFSGHPQIGDLTTLQAKYANTADKAGHEQSGMAEAEQEVLQEMLVLNKRYLERFGFIFIVFASGKSAAQMLELITTRINNDRATELSIAANEQAKITAKRLESL